MSSYVSPWVFLPDGRLALDSLCEDCWEGGPQLVIGIHRSGNGLVASTTECPRCGELNLWSQWLRTPPAGYAVYQVRWELSELDEKDLHFWLSGSLFIATSPQDAYQQAVARLVGRVPFYFYDFRQCFIETEYFQPPISSFFVEGEEEDQSGEDSGFPSQHN